MPSAGRPRPLPTTYEEVRPLGQSIIKQKVVLAMPPYRYDRGIGIQNLKYDLRLKPSGRFRRFLALV